MANGESESQCQRGVGAICGSNWSAFHEYNHHGSCMRRPPCRRNTITESRCRQCSVERRAGPYRRNTITEVAARASMPAESSLVSSTSSLPAPPAHECWHRLEPTSKRKATTGMSFSCAPALVSERGIARSEQRVHDISRQSFADSKAQAHRHFRHRLRANVGAKSSQHKQ